MRSTNTFGVHFTLRTSRSVNGKFPIYARIVVNKSRCELALKCLLKKEDWNVIKGAAKPRNDELRQFNSYLEQIRGSLVSHYRILNVNEQEVTAEAVIPAHPLVLDKNRKLDEDRQRRLTRYYIEAGAGGVAVGVHTTQFEIRKPEINLLETVLRLTAEEIEKANLTRPFIKVAGIVGTTESAVRDAALSVKYGYDLGLVSLGGLDHFSNAQLIAHVRRVAEIIPVFGFYLQPAVGGQVLGYEFWREFVKIPNVHAIKVAAFNRYQTLDVMRAVCHAERCADIALYTGNDDNIIADLVTPYRFTVNEKIVEKRFVGGLLGHWSVWTKQAVRIFAEIQECISMNIPVSPRLLSKGIEITDMNAVIFDAGNGFHGCIPGVHEVLRRQGLIEGRWCINPAEDLSVGQMEEIDRIYTMYTHNMDDEFVNLFLEKDNG